jgi:hypothetical protein
MQQQSKGLHAASHRPQPPRKALEWLSQMYDQLVRTTADPEFSTPCEQSCLYQHEQTTYRCCSQHSGPPNTTSWPHKPTSVPWLYSVAAPGGPWLCTSGGRAASRT